MNPSSSSNPNQQQYPTTSQSYDHVQSYAPYYNTSYQYDQQQQHYYQYYPSDYYTYYQQQDPNCSIQIHPPGVPIHQNSTTHLTGHEYGQTHLQNIDNNNNRNNNGYYSQGVSEQQQVNQNLAVSGGFGSGSIGPPSVGNAPIEGLIKIGQVPYGGRGRRGGRSFRGGGRGTGGRARGSFAPAGQSSNQGRGPQASISNAAPIRPPPQMAWCELCRVDCNTLEILEQHKNGKKHKKKLLEYERLQNLNQVITGTQSQQLPVSQSVPEVVQPEGVADTPADGNAIDETGKAPATDTTEVQVHGSKRSMKGGGGGKRIRRPFETPKPKQVIPLVCELCNIKCDTQAVFDTHLAGKKHLKKFQGYQAILGAVVLQALCQTNANLPLSSFLPRANQPAINGLQGLFSQPDPNALPPYQDNLPLNFTPARPEVGTQNSVDVVAEVKPEVGPQNSAGAVAETSPAMNNDVKTENAESDNAPTTLDALSSDQD